MYKYARVIGGFAVDVVVGNPADLFHAGVASQFVTAPNEVEIGWQLDPGSGSWSAPSPVETNSPRPSEHLQVSPIEFKLLFTAQERVVIKAARATDPMIDDFYDVVEDPRLTFVDLGLQSTRDAIGYLAEQGLIGTERVEQILAGVMQ